MPPGSRHRPQLSIDTSGVVFEPRTRSRAEHLRDEYMRSQVALNPSTTLRLRERSS